MSKTRIVEIIQQGGVNFGQITHPNDVALSQLYSHAHVEQLTQDFLADLENPTVVNCYHAVQGMSVQIGYGRIYRDGLQYDCAGGTFPLEPANNLRPRIDAVIATLTPNVPINLEFLAFQRIRTEQEFLDSVSPYPPTQFQRATERQHLAVVSVKTGTSAITPSLPALGANEVLLYSIRVPASSTELLEENVTDARNIISSLSFLSNALAQTVARLNDIENKLLVLKYRYPTILASNGKYPATIAQDNSVYVIDLPVAINIQFGDRFVTIEPENFQDPSVNARQAQNNANANVIRFNAPAQTKWLYINYEGELFFRTIGQPSTGTECLLLKITPNGGNPPEVKSYINARNAINLYSKLAVANNAASKQFEMDVAPPAETVIVEAYAVKASDKTRYELPAPNISFDSTVTVSGVTDGDTWIVKLFSLSSA